MEIVMLGVFGVLLIVLVISRFLWRLVRYSWIENIAKCLIWSLPFESFPRIDILGSGFRISQGLVIIGFWILTILLLKRDFTLLNKKLNETFVIPVIFVIVSSVSWFEIADLKRFFVHWIGAMLVFGAMIIIANFAKDIPKRLRELSIILCGCGLFGLFQFFGDLAGIPPTITLLREHYTKVVFGVPRVQGTAIEPLYFAGMLLIPIVTFVMYWSYNRTLTSTFLNNTDPILTFDSKAEPITSSKPILNPIKKAIFGIQKILSELFLFGVCLLAFVLTISKGTFGVLFVILPLIIYFAFQNSLELREFVRVRIIPIVCIVLFLVATGAVFVDPVRLFGSVGQNFVDTIEGTSPSAIERSRFVSEAIYALPKNILKGIGMGQYADYVGSNLGSVNNPDNKSIVNNVYLEIWLEEGFFGFVVFLMMIFYPIGRLWELARFGLDHHRDSISVPDNVDYKDSEKSLSINPNSKIIFDQPNIATTNQVESSVEFCKDPKSYRLTCQIIFLVIIAYYLQWTLFSPIFIMPIFVILGMAYNLTLSSTSLDKYSKIPKNP